MTGRPSPGADTQLDARAAGRGGATPAHGLVAIVGFLVCVELASGVLQGYYTPIFSDIADHLVDRATRTSTGSRPRS